MSPKWPRRAKTNRPLNAEASPTGILRYTRAGGHAPHRVGEPSLAPWRTAGFRPSRYHSLEVITKISVLPR